MSDCNNHDYFHAGYQKGAKDFALRMEARRGKKKMTFKMELFAMRDERLPLPCPCVACVQIQKEMEPVS